MLEIQVPEMDLSNYKPKLFGLSYREIICYGLFALLPIGILLYATWGTKSVDFYVPFIILFCIPAWFLGGRNDLTYGMKPEQFLMCIIRYKFLVPSKRTVSKKRHVNYAAKPSTTKSTVSKPAETAKRQTVVTKTQKTVVPEKKQPEIQNVQQRAVKAQNNILANNEPVKKPTVQQRPTQQPQKSMNIFD